LHPFLEASASSPTDPPARTEQRPTSIGGWAAVCPSRYIESGWDFPDAHLAAFEAASFTVGYARPELDVDQAHDLLERWLD